ncbi:MAG: FmdB family zinc ribbon protein [Parcubacteria group bacterium]
MPIYEFTCRQCQHNFRKTTSIKNKKAGKISCPECKSKNLQESYSTNSSKSCSSCSSSGCSSGCAGCH